MGETKSSASNNDHLLLVNITEEFVRRQAKITMKEMGSCECETCYLNVCALALNALPPQYVTTTRGALLLGITATETGNSALILVEVTKAVMKVMENPHH